MSDSDRTEAHPPQQEEMPFALVQGEAVTELPKDLYIPPDALEVILEAFEGPLDLLLYLIRRQNLDVLEIPIAEITRQYMTYVSLMHGLRLELAAEYLVMAAVLAEIKSRMLLPRRTEEEGEEEDPRAELIRRLQEYERYKQAAEDLDTLPRLERDLFTAGIEVAERKVLRIEPQVEMRDMLLALADVLRRAELFSHHQIEREPLSVRERMSQLLTRITSDRFAEFPQLFPVDEGRAGVVVSFLAMLELLKGGMIELVQGEPFGMIHVRARSGEEPVPEDGAEEPEPREADDGT